MPELPEVETIRRTLLCKKILGKQVKKISIPPSRLLRNSLPDRKKFLTSFPGQVITRLERWGKYLLLGSESHPLIIHLGMSGIILWQEPDAPVPELRKHLYLRIFFHDKSEFLFFNPRTFGRILLPVPGSRGGWELFPQMKALGPDALLTPSPQLVKQVQKKTLRSHRRIKNILLDQTILAGVGNIYADESLFLSRISPLRPACSLGAEEWHSLIRYLRKVFRKAIGYGGSTLHDYRRPDGLAGNFQSEFLVYGKAGKPCPRCDEPLTRIVLQARSSVYCPLCQK